MPPRTPNGGSTSGGGGGGSYAAIHAASEAQRVLHLKTTPSKATPRKPKEPQFFSYDQAMAKQKQVAESQSPAPVGPQTAQVATSPVASSPARPSTARVPVMTVTIPGFPGMDSNEKSASGSGGEKTLRHRLFPMHDIPQDGDPHRAMFKTVNEINEARTRHFHGTNPIPEAYINPQPMYTRPPPPRTLSEFGKLMAPEIHATPNDQPSWEHSTKYKPREQGRTVASPQSDPHALFYSELFPSGAQPTQKYRPAQAPAYDGSRAGHHSVDAKASARKRGLGMVQAPYYTSSSLVLDFSAVDLDGRIIATPAEAREAKARVAGRPFASHDGTDAHLPVDQRPGAKPQSSETLALRRSDAVASLMRDPGDGPRASLPAGTSIRIDHAQRQRDFGQNSNFNIITLAGAGGETGRDPITSDRTSQWDSRGNVGAGRPSREQHSRDHDNTRRATGTGSTASGSSQANYVSSLDNQCREVPGASPPRQVTTTARRDVSSDSRSDNMWALLTNR